MSSSLWPIDACLQSEDITIAGCSLRELARAFGTPLYVYSRATIEDAVTAYHDGLAAYAGGYRIHYASKAWLTTALAQLLLTLDCGVDVVSAAELALVQRAGVRHDDIHFHGNGTPVAELAAAVAAGTPVVVDNRDQLEALVSLTTDRPTPHPVLLRVAPGIAAGGHTYLQTGTTQAKFGFPIDDGQAQRAAARALASPGIALRGLHAHVGSQIDDNTVVRQTVDRLLDLAAHLKREYGWRMRELSPGGGVAVRTEPPGRIPAVGAYCAALVAAVASGCQQRGLALPQLSVEPGRSIVGRAGVAVYTVTGRKYVDGRLTHVHVDGGMGDNIRPALYDAVYTARSVERPLAAPATTPVTVAGRYCESGDILLRDVALPLLEPGDRLAVPSAGAYTLSMASNYNGIGRPAVLLAADGVAHLIQRREQPPALWARDIALPQ